MRIPIIPSRWVPKILKFVCIPFVTPINLLIIRAVKFFERTPKWKAGPDGLRVEYRGQAVIEMEWLGTDLVIKLESGEERIFRGLQERKGGIFRTKHRSTGLVMILDIGSGELVG